MAHAELLREEDPGSRLASQLGGNYRQAGLTKKQMGMLEFAESLTVSPATVMEDQVEGLRELGWTDGDVVDIVHITALYNYMVRIADGLGIELEPGRGWEPLAERLSFRGGTASRSFGNMLEGSPG